MEAEQHQYESYQAGQSGAEEAPLPSESSHDGANEYEGNLHSDEFLERTTFKAYKNLPLFLNFGFAFGAFDKNALFYAI